MTTARLVRTPAPASRRGGDRSRMRWLLAAGWLAQVVLRLWLYRYHAGPSANPDESGYLLAARWLAGGAGADLSTSTFYQAGYALLLVPAFWATSDPVVAYRLVVVVGTLVAAGAFPMAYLLLRRLRLGRRAAVAVAFAAGLSPALLLFPGLALADAVLPVVVLGWLVAVHDLVARRSAGAGAVAGGLAAYAMAVHLRGSVIVTVFLLLLALLFRRLPRRAVLAASAAAVAGAVAGEALNGVLKSALYPGGTRDLSGLLLTRLTSLEGQAWALSGAAGQLWYLIAGTWGLAGVGLAGVAVTLVRGSAAAPPARGSARGLPARLVAALPARLVAAPPARGSAPFPERVLAGTLLAATLGIAYASSAALPDEHRVGNYAYGRYLACVAVAWTLAGMLALLRSGRRAAQPRGGGGAVEWRGAGGAVQPPWLCWAAWRERPCSPPGGSGRSPRACWR